MGRSLSLDLLTRIPPNDLPDAFQKLVTANAGSLSAKAVRVAKTEVRLGDPDDVFEWFLSGGNLALRGSNFTAYIAANLSRVCRPCLDEMVRQSPRSESELSHRV